MSPACNNTKTKWGWGQGWLWIFYRGYTSAKADKCYITITTVVLTAAYDDVPDCLVRLSRRIILVILIRTATGLNVNCIFSPTLFVAAFVFFLFPPSFSLSLSSSSSSSFSSSSCFAFFFTKKLRVTQSLSGLHVQSSNPQRTVRCVLALARSSEQRLQE